MENKLENLADTMFELMEDISKLEETIEKGKKDFESVKEMVDSLKQAQDSANSAGDSAPNMSLDEILERVNKIEKSITTIAKSENIAHLSQNIDKRVLLKSEISKYQTMILVILLIMTLGSVAFFMMELASSLNATIAFLAMVAFFVIALIIINANLKTSIAEEKITPKKADSAK
ncbi:hypothetical protein ACWIUD_03925 [Helicobacter sp. 23-1044]